MSPESHAAADQTRSRGHARYAGGVRPVADGAERRIAVPADRAAEFDRGFRLLVELGEVMPEDASGEVAEVYDDVRRTLRVPFVNFLFRALANYPGALVDLWRAARPALGTLAFERAADHLRAAAVLEPIPSAPSVDWRHMAELGRVRAFTASIHYVLPKLLLLATGLDRLLRGGDAGGASAGEPVRWYGLGAEEKLSDGPAEGTVQIPLLDPKRAEGQVKRIFEEIRAAHEHPGVASYYRALGHWPELLAALWSAVQPDLGSERRTARKPELIGLAARLEAGLPSRGQRQGPAADAVRDEVGAILAVFRFRLVPDLLLDVCRIREVLEGPGAGARSVFSMAEPRSAGDR